MDGDGLTPWRLLRRAKHRLRVLGFILFGGAAYIASIAAAQQQESANAQEARGDDSQRANTQTPKDKSQGGLGTDVYTDLARATGGFAYNGPHQYLSETTKTFLILSDPGAHSLTWVTGTVESPPSVDIPVTVDGTATQLDFVLGTYAKESAVMELRRPDDTLVRKDECAEYISIPTLHHIRLLSPVPGRWTVRITGKARYELSALAKSKVRLQAVSFFPLISDADTLGKPRIGGDLPMQQRLRLEVGLEGIVDPVATLTLFDGTPIATVPLRPYRDAPEATRKRMPIRTFSPRVRYDGFDRQSYYFGEVFFSEPSQDFRVTVSGEDAAGIPLNRLLRRVFRASESPEQAEPEPTSEDTERHRKRFYTLLEQEKNSEPWARPAQDYLRSLPTVARLALARTISNDPDAMIGYAGCQILIAEGHIDEAVPPLAAMIVSGRAQTQLNGRMGYDWVHSDDDTLATRMMLSISRHLLAHFDAYDTDERRNAQVFLVGPRAPFTTEAAQRRIDEMEAKLQDIIRRQEPPTSGTAEKD